MTLLDHMSHHLTILYRGLKFNNLNGSKLNGFKTKGLKLNANKGLKLQLNLDILTEILLSTSCKATGQILKLTL